MNSLRLRLPSPKPEPPHPPAAWGEGIQTHSCNTPLGFCLPDGLLEGTPSLQSLPSG